MNIFRFGFAAPALAALAFSAASPAPAQSSRQPDYLNPHLPAAARAADLVHRMTLEEKATQLVNQARAIPRLHVPAYDWWSEALHGVMVNGTTEFPEPIGLASTFDPASIHAMAVAIGVEGRIKHAQALRAHGGASNIFQGLDFWAPNINIFRDPRWGRGQETYGEDPFLTARMGVAFVTGMQGDDPHYYRTIATPKHFAVHSGPEPTRHEADVAVSKHDELDTYLPAFRATVVEGKAGSVMCAYNSINGQPACANQFLLENQLRGKWNFGGYVVSDCGAVRNIVDGHHYQPTQPQASAISLERGMDNECVDFTTPVTDDHDYKPYLDAVKQGYVKESDIDRALIRLFTARIKLGMFDPPSMVPYSKIDESELNSPAHRALALKLANESMVLLKNDGTLPLKTSGIKIAVVGPLASQTRVLLGNYNGIPTHTVSILEGLRKEFAGDSIQYEPGTQFLSTDYQPVPSALLTTAGEPGVKATYLKGDIVTYLSITPQLTTLVSRTEPNIDTSEQPLPAQAAAVTPLALHWETTLTPQSTGEYDLGLQADGFFRIALDGHVIANADDTHGVETKAGRVHLEAGKPYQIAVDYSQANRPVPRARLVWMLVNDTPDPAAIEAARNADVLIAVVGLTSQLEGEEMKIELPGFRGGDRTSLDLPQPEEDLLHALAATGKPLVVVLTNGSALAVNWASAHANAILDAWYPGEEGGAAVAQTLSGRNNPAGRLPVTFYKGVDQLPPFDDYSMKNRTYRYFTGTPLFPFGYGLSYTSFAYSGLHLPAAPVKAGDPLSGTVTITNSGTVEGDEVAQLYLTFPALPGAPLRALRAFKRVHLAPGASVEWRFSLAPRDLSMVTDAGQIIVAEGAYTVSIGGGQPDTGAPAVTGTFNVQGSLALPE